MEKEDILGRPYNMFNDMRKANVFGNRIAKTVRGFTVNR